jgi:hypothetical protein
MLTGTCQGQILSQTSGFKYDNKTVMAHSVTHHTDFTMAFFTFKLSYGSTVHA